MAKSPARRTQKTSASQLINHEVKIGVFGAGGRMGQEILQLWKQAFGRPMALAVGSEVSKDLAEVVCKDLTDERVQEVDVWIEFTSPQGLKKILEHCVLNNKPLVSGTTGLTKENQRSLKVAAKKIPLLWSPNMSIGINVLLKALKSLRGINGFDFQIEEVHHRYKKDKPSGTALLIQEELQKVIARKPAETLALRGGGIYGIHKVWAMADEEFLVFEHQALGRKVFAKGAIDAALWVYTKAPGFYSMQDLLGTPSES